LPLVRVSNAGGSADIYLHGAHVAAWHPAGQAPVLWVSRDSLFRADRPIRGGVPICFPWFASHATDSTVPAHGFARVSEWRLDEASDESGERTRLQFRLEGQDRSPVWPHAFLALYRVTVGRTLHLELEITNRGSTPVTFEEALHTYYAVHNVREVAITGLEHTEYLDKVAAMAKKRQGSDPIRFEGETDRIYLQTRGACTIHDPGRRRRLHVRKQGSEATVVWNPWIDKARAMPDFGDLEWPEMVCVETANVGPHAVGLAPGASHVMAAEIIVEAI
jgi:glucose-6-phosphate 1-epimerase